MDPVFIGIRLVHILPETGKLNCSYKLLKKGRNCSINCPLRAQFFSLEWPNLTTVRTLAPRNCSFLREWQEAQLVVATAHAVKHLRMAEIAFLVKNPENCRKNCRQIVDTRSIYSL